MPPKSTNGPFDSDKEFLMRLVFNAKIPITEACKEIAQQTGENAETLRQRFYKLKREADGLINKSGNGSNTSTTPATPSSASKSGPKAKASAKSTGRGKKRAMTEDNETQEESEAEESPSKKKKVKKESAKENSAQAEVTEEEF